MSEQTALSRFHDDDFYRKKEGGKKYRDSRQVEKLKRKPNSEYFQFKYLLNN